MRFTQETDYAFRIVQTFAKKGPGSYFTASDMSEQESIPYRFLLRVLGKLKKAKIVESRQGVDGGYRLARPADQVSLRDVVEAVEGEVRINRCLKNVSLCNAGHAPECSVHRALGQIQERFLKDLERHNFSNIEDISRYYGE